MSNQDRHPLFDALVEYSLQGTTPFDVPGHKLGQGLNPRFTEFIGSNITKIDVNSMPELDNLSNPENVIAQSEQLAAEFFQTDNAFFMVNGSTAGVQSMILASINPGDTIIIPRNIHKSAINALILAGANPVYVYPEIDTRMGISVGTSVDANLEAINKHPEAKAILLLHPTYYGFTSPLEPIITEAHNHGMVVLVDESHGTHFYLDHRFGTPSMHHKADLATISVHKTGGSLTQSSILLHNEGRISKNKVRSAINLLQTSSASYLLMASLDMARHYLATKKDLGHRIFDLSTYAMDQLQQVQNIQVIPNKMVVNGTTFHHDISKLLIDVRPTGLTGQEVYSMMKSKYNIQLELGESNIILAIISLGDTTESIDKLVDALSQIASEYKGNPKDVGVRHFIYPVVLHSPRQAYFSDTEFIELHEAIGRVSGDQIMIYPPGIPLLVPGELITKEIVEEYIKLIEQGNKVVGSVSDGTIKIKVTKEVLS